MKENSEEALAVAQGDDAELAVAFSCPCSPATNCISAFEEDTLSFMLAEMLVTWEQESVDDEQVKRIVEPVCLMIVSGAFNRLLRKRRRILRTHINKKGKP